jgi:RNA polymerase sigma factor (sigma-70 family)
MSADSCKPLLLKARLVNNRMIQARKALGYESASDLSRIAGVHISTVCSLECLKISPVSKRTGMWTSAALKIAVALNAPPDHLWPEVTLAVKKPFSEIELDEDAVMSLQEAMNPEARLVLNDDLAAAVKAIGTLSDRYARILKLRFGLEDGEEHSFDDIAAVLGVTGTRVQQLNQKAIKKLRAAVAASEKTQTEL